MKTSRGRWIGKMAVVVALLAWGATGSVRAANLYWNTGTGAWDINTTANWAGDATLFNNGDTVTFTNRGSDATVTVAAGGVQPGSMTVSNNANTYTFSGAAIGSAAGSLVKANSGNATFNTDNTGIAGGIQVYGGGITKFNTNIAMGAAGRLTIDQDSSIDIGFNNVTGSSGAGDLSRLNVSSRGTIVLAGSTYTSALDLSGYSPALRLGTTVFGTAGGHVFSGGLTPADDTYRFGGGGGGLAISTVLADGSAARKVLARGKGIPRANCNMTMVTLRSACTYSGQTRVMNGSYLRVGGSSGSAVNTPLVVVEDNGILGLDPGLRAFGWGDDASVPVGNSNDRLGDSAVVRLRGGTLFFFGNPNTGTAETIGQLDVGAGHSVVDARYSNHLPYVGEVDDANSRVKLNGFNLTTHSTLTGSQACDLTFGQLTRNATENGQMVVRGNNLGGSGATGASRIKFTTPPTMIGGGGGAGTTTMSVIPFLYAGGNGNSGNSLITHDANGLRALNTATEFAPLAIGTTTANNTIINDSTNVTYTVSADTTVNSLFVAASGQNTTLNNSGGSKLILSSGVLMIQLQAPSDGGTWTMTCPVDFAGQEGNVYYMGRSFYSAYVDSIFSNTGGKGLSISAVIGTYVGDMQLRGASTYTGPTTINRGNVSTSGNEKIPDSSDLRVRAGAKFSIGGGNTETVASLAGAGTLNFGSTGSRLILGGGSGVAGAVTLEGAGAYIAPGDGTNSAGTLTLSGLSTSDGVRLRSGELRIDLESALDGDVLSVGSTKVTISDPGNGYAGSTLVLSLGFTPTVGDTFRIVDVGGATAVVGKFSNGDSIKVASGSDVLLFKILYNSSLGGGDGNDIVLQYAGPIPRGALIMLR